LKFPSPALVDAEITRLEERLGVLRRRQRGVLGGHASGSARQKHYRDAQIRAFYRHRNGEPGITKRIAAEVKLSERQVRRILRTGAVRGDRVIDAHGGDLFEGKDDENAARRSNGAPPAVDSAAGDSTSPAAKAASRGSVRVKKTNYSRMVWLHELLRDAEGLIEAMYEQAAEARIPGGPQFDLEAALRLIGEFAGQWDVLLSYLENAFEPTSRRKREDEEF
jgi:hypothetical protein